MQLSSPIYKLKRQAKLLARDGKIKLHEALNQVAAKEGFNDWSHLASSHAKTTPAHTILKQLSAGDMVLIAARPGHGKTLLGLELTALAQSANRTSFVFSLDYTERDVWDQFGKLGYDRDRFEPPVVVDTSDKICAEYIVNRLGKPPENAFVVVDFLQLLDQRRSNPPLDRQIQTLKTFAKAHLATVVVISQIDRSFDPSARGLPGIEDVRLPNPVDLSLFNKRCFLHDGEVRMERAA